MTLSALARALGRAPVADAGSERLLRRARRRLSRAVPQWAGFRVADSGLYIGFDMATWREEDVGEGGGGVGAAHTRAPSMREARLSEQRRRSTRLAQGQSCPIRQCSRRASRQSGRDGAPRARPLDALARPLHPWLSCNELGEHNPPRTHSAETPTRAVGARSVQCSCGAARHAGGSRLGARHARGPCDAVAGAAGMGHRADSGDCSPHRWAAGAGGREGAAKEI